MEGIVLVLILCYRKVMMKRKMTERIVLMGGGFLPNSLSNLTLWLDGADATTITESANKVSQWDDKSGTKNAVQGTGIDQPNFNATGLNGKGTVTGDGSDFMLIPQPIPSLTEDVTIFMVLKQNSGDNFKALMAWRDSAFPARFSTGSSGAGSLIFFDSGFGNLTIAPNELSTSAFSVVTFTTTSTDMVTRVNGVETSHHTFTGKNWGTAQGTDMSIFSRVNGSSGSRDGIAELGIYLDTKNATEISRIEKYLGNKWGITIA